ncbi:MAG TPA: 3'(2'),5'-bisphosphate nucleotidase CysQ [Candidatus Elarobacter sp.]|jgi:3'(2'), 5'-bisphosphate nucleotidase
MAGSDTLAASDLATLLRVVRDAALRAGDAILAVASEGAVEASSKSDDSPLTRADLAADAVLLDALRRLDPRGVVISEETPCEPAERPHRFWLVDPLDGTREFIAGTGEYTVNVALVEDGVPVLGVVHAPARAVTYEAVRGGGATRTDARGTRRIHASAGGPLRVLTTRSHPSPARAAFLAALPPHRLVEFGSSLKLCLVADGSAQLYPRLGPTSWWDTAAGHAVVLEAGGSVTTLDGAPLRYAGSGLLNPGFVCASVPRDVWAPAARAVR